MALQGHTEVKSIGKWKYFRMRNGRCGRHRLRKRSKKTTQFCQSNKEEYILLRKWMCSFDKRCKIDLEPCMFLETGRGLQTKDVLYQGEIILSIPECALVTPKTVLSSEFGEILKKCVPPLSPQRILSVFLILEAEKGPASFWFPYLQTLPVKFTTPLYFSTEELRRLPPCVYHNACVDQKRVQDIWSDIFSFLSTHFLEHEFFTYEKFRWAWCVVNTRSVYVKTEESPYLTLIENETDVALAPYLDLLNHSSFAKTEAKLNLETGRYEIISHDHYQKYSQVFIHYHSYSNENLFLEYGFTLPENPFNRYEFTSEDISRLIEEFVISDWDRKQSILKEHNLDEGLTCSVDGISWQLQTLLRVAAMTWEELKTWKSAYEGQVSQSNELKAVSMAESLIRMALQITKKYLTKSPNSLSDHKRLALTLTQDNQDILERSLNLLKKLHL